MNFEYNGNLLEEDRINLVANEIVNKYSHISLEKAKEAARLEAKISKPKTVDDELNRLYNIMLVNSDNKNIVITIFVDYLKIVNSNTMASNIYVNLVDGINSYFIDDAEFPIISDYY